MIRIGMVPLMNADAQITNLFYVITVWQSWCVFVLGSLGWAVDMGVSLVLLRPIQK